jgi:hypothetical protein
MSKPKAVLIAFARNDKGRTLGRSGPIRRQFAIKCKCRETLTALDVLDGKCGIVLDSVAMADRSSARTRYKVSRLAEHVAFVQHKDGDRRCPARVTCTGLGSRAGEAAAPRPVIQSVRMENQIQMVGPVNGTPFPRVRAFRMCRAHAFSRKARWAIRIGASKYTSGTARGSERRNSLESFRAEEAPASLFAFGIRAYHWSVLGCVAHSSIAADGETSNSCATGYNLRESYLLVCHLCLFIRTKRPELTCHDSPPYNLHGGIKPGYLCGRISHCYHDSDRGSNLRVPGVIFRKTIGCQQPAQIQ